MRVPKLAKNTILFVLALTAAAAGFAAAPSQQCISDAYARIRNCRWGKMGRSACVYLAANRPSCAQDSSPESQFVQSLEKYYDSLHKNGEDEHDQHTPHNDDANNPPPDNQNTGNGGHHAAQTDRHIQHLMDDILKGKFANDTLREFFNHMRDRGFTHEQLDQIRHFAEANRNRFKNPGPHEEQPYADEPQTAKPQASAHTARPSPHTAVTVPQAARTDYLPKKGISQDSLEHNLGITRNAEAEAAFKGAVIVDGRYSQPARGVRPAQPPRAAQSELSAGSVRLVQAPRAEPGEAGQYAVNSGDYRQSMAYASQANVKMSLKDYAGAAREASNSISKNPANHGAWLIRAAAGNYLGKYADAIADSSFVIKNDPLNADAYNIRAWAYAQTGNFAAAKSDASRAIQLNPGLASAFYNRSVISEKTGDYRQMLEDLREASRLDKSYVSRFRDAVAKYRSQVPGFEYKGAAFPDTETARTQAQPAPQADPARRLGWRKAYILIGSLAVGVFILMQLLRALRVGEKTAAAPPGGLMNNQFLMVRQVGEGGMGIVYEGYDRALKRKVAIKRLRADLDMSDAAKEQLLNEARTVAALHHPNIVEIYTVFEENGDLFLVFEYVEGQTLDQRLEKEGRLPLKEAKSIFRSICRALDYAHENHIIHRDLKPGNIMISKAGVVKVMDFGVARQLVGGLAPRTVSGTPAYMPPEQLRGVVRRESDIYSLGVCLYETVTGHVPWELAGTDSAQGSIIAPSQLVPSLPAELDALLERAITADINSRISAAGEFWRLLDAVPL